MKLVRLFTIPALVLTGLVVGAAATMQSFDAARPQARADLVLAQSEAYVPQASGFLTRSALPPLRRASRASNGGFPHGAPINCTSANAMSPHCYTATQQGRPVPR
jgi:hypothetical protein